MKANQGADLRKEWQDFILNGSEKAYHALYTHYYHYLSFLGLKKGAETVNVKNHINDLFLYLWENRIRLGGVREHHNYIVTAFLRKLLRKEHFREIYSPELYDFAEYAAVPSVESAYIHEHTRISTSKMLQNYVDRLPVKQRGIIYQKFYLGLSYQEISQANGISVNTVYNTVYKALEKLKQLLSKEHPETLSLALTALSIFFLFFF